MASRHFFSWGKSGTQIIIKLEQSYFADKFIIDNETPPKKNLGKIIIFEYQNLGGANTDACLLENVNIF